MVNGKSVKSTACEEGIKAIVRIWWSFAWSILRKSNFNHMF